MPRRQDLHPRHSRPAVREHGGVGQDIGSAAAHSEGRGSELLAAAQGGANALSIARGLRAIYAKAAQAAPSTLERDDTGYCVTSLVRKVVLALLASGRASADWGSLRRSELEELCCDQSEFLKAVPQAWSAADISNFMFGRSDWGMFVSLYACFMKDALRSLKIETGQSGAVLEILASSTFGRAADALRAQHGHAVHPTLVLQELCRQGHDLRGPTVSSSPRTGAHRAGRGTQ